RVRRAGARPAHLQARPAAAAGRLMSFAGRHVLLGVSGGIACYKSCTLARRLTEGGAAVDVVLTASAAEFVRPVTFEALTGPLVEGPSERPGRMSEPEVLLAAAARLLEQRAPWLGKQVVVTAGPTREHLDPIRVVTNPSSGRMGYAIAAAAHTRGADVVLVSGPSDLPLPFGVTTHRVETTADMQRAVDGLVKHANVLVMAAAPADYRPARPAAGKRPRASGALTLELEATPDILASLKRPPGCLVVGFALEAPGAEGGNGVAQAQAKLREKHLDYIILNNALEPGAGFEVTTNRVTIIGKSGTPIELPLLDKRDVAERILDAVEQALT